MKNIKRIVWLFNAIIVLTLLGGCSRQSKFAETSKESINEEIDSKISEEVLEKESMDIQVNTEEKVVVYEYNGQEGFVEKCVANNQNLYLLQSDSYTEKPSVYSMGIGEANSEKLNIDIPDNMEICNITVDIAGNLHLLIHSDKKNAGTEQQEWQIWELDSNYNIIQKLNVSAAFEGKTYPPYGFYIDKLGYYYIQGTWEMVPNMVLDSQGILVNTIYSEDLGVDFVQSVGRGKDGKIYMVYSGEKVGTVGILDGVNGCIEKEYEKLLPEDEDEFFLIAPGTDTDLLMYSAHSGLWVCNLQDNNAIQRVEMTEGNIALTTVILARSILPDGRLLIIENILDDNGNFKYRNFRYIAGGK